MTRLMLLLSLLLMTSHAISEEAQVWDLQTPDGNFISQIAIEPSIGDEYIAADNQKYIVVDIQNQIALVEPRGTIVLPSVDWLNVSEDTTAVLAANHRLAIYCTHSDESYEPSDGYYSTRGRGSIYQVAHELASSFNSRGIETTVADQLHHPHDAGAYRRSRQTAVQLLKNVLPDCLIDLHRDGIKDPSAYAATVHGKDVSKIRLLVGRGNQNASLNKEFALLIKAVADQLYPGLIKDIYLGKGTFNQDLLPRSILLECGTYTLSKERVLASMPMIAEVFDLALYGDKRSSFDQAIVPDPNDHATISSSAGASGITDGFGFLGLILGIGVVGLAILSAGSLKAGTRKAARNLSEMTGGLIGSKPQRDEDPNHS